MPLLPRTRLVSVRLTPAEWRAVAKAARAAGMTTSEWVRARSVPQGTDSQPKGASHK